MRQLDKLTGFESSSNIGNGMVFKSEIRADEARGSKLG